MITPVLLIILDGFGYRPNGADNAIFHANTPHWDDLWNTYPHDTLEASEQRVGLPAGQFGNSEVGHLNIGAGRVVRQDLTRVDVAIEDGSLRQNPVLSDTLLAAIRQDKVVHILGLLSDGGVHSHQAHLHAAIEMALALGARKVCLHAFLDGRDTPPQSAAIYLQRFAERFAAEPRVCLASVCGRYYAMDRDQRWERLAPAYRLLTEGVGEYSAVDAAAALAAAYARGENDEFVRATALAPSGEPAPHIQDGDAVVFMNFRADRARQLTAALTFDDFQGFARPARPQLAAFCSLTSYGVEYTHPVAFAPQTVRNGFGATLAQHGLRQLRIAETEKYAHVTYFFNGGEETPNPLEDRILVPSPKVATYDLQPEMSAFEVAEKLEAAIRSRQYQALIVNFANGDMVGHTGMFGAAIKAVEALDQCLGQVVAAMREVGGEVLITADHGNCEQMIDEQGVPHTQHSMNPVPLIYVGRPAKLRSGGALQDIAPTLLAMMGLPKPVEMTGSNLIEWQ